jgi:hypothetical protein
MDKIAITIGTVLAVVVEKVANGIKLIAKFSDELGFALKVIISLKIGAMFVRWAIALRTVYLSLAAIVGLSGVGLKLVAASAVAAGAAYVALGIELDKIGEKINKNFGAKKQLTGAGPWTMFGVGAEKVKKPVKEVESILGNVASQIKKINKEFDISKELTGMIKTSVGSFSKSIAESIVLGKKLNQSMKELAESILVSILAKTIERILLKQIEKVLDIAAEAWENRKLNLMHHQTNEMKRQLQIQTTMMAMSGNPMALIGVFGGAFHKGGSVSKGKPIVVGERGPEMFIPNQTGQITQNARGTGGSPVNVNFTVNAIDTRGFQEALIQNRGTISNIINQAVNERGAKNLI